MVFAKPRRKKHFSLDEPFQNLPTPIQDLVLYGSKDYPEYEGVIPRMERAHLETSSEYLRAEIAKYMSEITCPACQGARLSPEALAVKIDQKNIHEICSLPVREEISFFNNLQTKINRQRKRNCS